MLRIEETCVREAGLSSVKASRLLLESVTIVGSILLAFAIDAWWDGRSHDTLVREQRAALAAQMRANQALLTRAPTRLAAPFKPLSSWYG